MKKALLIIVCFAQIFLLSSCMYFGDSRQEIIDRRRAEQDHEAELIRTGYDDGYADGLDNGYDIGYEEGYAAGHQEAQHHSETFDRLLREAYQSTGGSGAGFKKDESGNIFVLETAPDGREIWVPFEP